jgi:signal transduction histidine kinase
LGLSISREIVHAYGGCIRACNRNGDGDGEGRGASANGAGAVAGARFIVQLPAADAAVKGTQLLARRN